MRSADRVGTLAGITGLYKPFDATRGFDLSGINVHQSNALSFLHSNGNGDAANFIWSRSICAENAITDFFGRGAIAEYFVEAGGVTYAVSEWVIPASENICRLFGEDL